MQLDDGVSLDIYLGKIGEVKFPKSVIPKFFDGTLQKIFLENAEKQ